MTNESENIFEEPHDGDAEVSVVGSMMLSKSAAKDAVELLRPQDFYILEHRFIFQAVVEAVEKYDATDPVTVASVLKKQGTLDKVGGFETLSAIESATVTAANVRSHASIIREHSLKRTLISVSEKAKEAGYSSPDVEAEIESYSRQLGDLQAFDKETDRIKVVGELTEKTNDFIEEAQAAEGGLLGVPSGIHALDQITRGWQKQRLYILAARPAMGKSLASLEFARHAAAEGLTVGFFSLEMSQIEVTLRLAARMSGISNEILSGEGTLDNEQRERLKKTFLDMKELSLYVDEDPSPTVHTVRRRCERIVSVAGSLDLVFVDYLQLVKPPSGRTQSRQEDVASVSRDLKVMSKDFDIPVIALSQLSRKVEERTDKRPQLADLRESGSLEQDADLVGFLYRDEVYDESSLDSGIIEFIIKKNRSGRSNLVAKAAFLAHLYSIRNLADKLEPSEPPPEEQPPPF